MIDADAAIAAIDAAIAKAERIDRLAIELDQPRLSAYARELQQALTEARSAGVALTRRIQELQAELTRFDQVLVEKGLYWRVIGEKKIDGPFCPMCYKTSGTLVKLKYHPGALEPHGHAPSYQCEACGGVFEPSPAGGA